MGDFARDGLLMSCDPVQRDMFRLAPMLVAKILDGTRLQAFRFNFSLVINQKTAKEFGLTIPQSLRGAG